MGKLSLGACALIVVMFGIAVAAWMLRYTPVNNAMVWDRWTHDMCFVEFASQGKHIKCMGDE
ncbi:MULTISPECIES: hypothetical protein [Burkholderia]|uniref:Uncharacterized protein n=1 Tax=Burkholderia contaminans TaxID=488447 RepID=A0A2S5DRG9_9BURK|nr:MULTISPECIES: hypothetical protein [Burkholderia]EKS9798266.1 hypothetical protein [Burkholderia cepacia]EKS9805750.1 hypothetical protein [Burkholderia cepacia]EKS9813105.1 hypothetical protein [Burkholderia cepacia]EKS9822117.1 hypothetical protein [Burkholderia cepacia]EKS9827346.1 hypothetical protein [Burkholderia cepacia]